MENKFNLYDFFGYIIPGGVLGFGLILIFFRIDHIAILVRALEPYKYLAGFSLVLISYAIGHVVSFAGYLILEKFFVGKIVGYPSKNFFDQDKKKGWFFAGYRQEYDRNFIKKIYGLYKNTFGTNFTSFDGFMSCFHYVKENSEPTRERLNIFLNSYDFCRNMTVSLLILGITLLIINGIAIGTFLFWLGINMIFLATIYLNRYLKFFRQYGDEVFRSFYVLSLQRK